MRAVVCTAYGPPEVLQLEEVPKPVPRDNEILVRVHATTVHAGDVRIRSFNIPGPAWQRLIGRLYLGWSRPKQPILGMDLAGEVEVVGQNVERFQPGDRVFGSTLWAGFGAYAEYKSLPENTKVTRMPADLSYEEAAPIPSGGLTALCVLRLAEIEPGQKMLIYGASGSVGSFAVQLAREMGAEVTAVCSTSNLDWVRDLGAAHVIDYTREDFTAAGESYDAIFDAVGKLEPEYGQRALAQGGTYLNVNTSSDQCEINNDDLDFLRDLAEAGKLRAAIDRIYPLEEIVEAHRYVEQGHKKGNVVITVAGDAG